MKILDNNVVREMTEEEIAMFSHSADSSPADDITQQKAEAYDILMGVEV